jgi:hypothetical protein
MISSSDAHFEIDSDLNITFSHGEQATYQIHGEAVIYFVDEIKNLRQNNLILNSVVKHLRELTDLLYPEHNADHLDDPLNCMRCRGLDIYEDMRRYIDIRQKI